MHKRIVIIGASDLQLPLILKAKEMGFETHVFAWAADDVGEKAADIFYPISITEIDQILEECRKIKPIAVVSIASDLAAITVTKVANALGLPSNPIETATIATNKYEMRRAFQRAGLSTPRFIRVGKDDDLSEVQKMVLPIIVKPTDRSGSRGIYKIESLKEINKYIEASCEESFENKAIIEEYIEGNEYSCECITQSGVHHFLTITKKYTTGAPHFIEIGHMEPSGLDEETISRVKKQVFIALDTLHVKCGASHSEFKVTPDGQIRLIEVGARMGGDCIGSDLVHLSTGLDFIRMTIQAALGEPIQLQPDQHKKIAAVRYIMNENDFLHFQDLKQNNPDNLVRASEIHFKQGSLVTDSSKRYGFYIMTGNDAETVKSQMQLEEC